MSKKASSRPVAETVSPSDHITIDAIRTCLQSVLDACNADHKQVEYRTHINDAVDGHVYGEWMPRVGSLRYVLEKVVWSKITEDQRAALQKLREWMHSGTHEFWYPSVLAKREVQAALTTFPAKEIQAIPNWSDLGFIPRHARVLAAFDGGEPLSYKQLKERLGEFLISDDGVDKIVRRINEKLIEIAHEINGIYHIERDKKRWVRIFKKSDTVGNRT